MNSYFAYYLAWIVLAYALHRPWLLLGIVVLLLLRRFIPVPAALLRFGRARSLRSQVELNRANITARRDLAVIYLDGVRPRAAIPLLEQGLALSPNDPELLYLFGFALHRSGRHEEALAPLVRAVELDPRVRYGLPYAVAGDALAVLKRWDGALDAYEHYLVDNSSDVSAYTRLARAHAKTGDGVAAREALREGLRTWGMLPASMKRRQFGRYLGAHWARVSVLREPLAIVTALALSAAFALSARFAYAPLLSLFSPSPPWYARTNMSAGYRALYEGFERCGSQSTADFAGRYEVLEENWAIPPSASETQREAHEELAEFMREYHANFEIRSDRIVSGTSWVQEYCLSRVLERTKTTLVAEAVWHEDVADPGDASLVKIRLAREGELTTMQVQDLRSGEGTSHKFKLKRRSTPSTGSAP